MRMIVPSAQCRGIRVLFPAVLQGWVIADRNRLRQVLLNLLSNAVKDNRDSGTVIVDVATEQDDGIRIAVQDTGHGLRPEQLASLFQPFKRLGQEGGKVEGTGIGLIVTKRLVELMGGTIEVKSTVGAACVFSVVSKAAERTAAEVASSAGLGATRPGLRMVGRDAPARSLALHVEDNPANLRLVREILEMRGDLRQMSAPDARLGIELARAHLAQVIQMDVNLPGLSGLQARTILQAGPLTSRIPVIAITANAMAGDVARGLAAGLFR